MRWSKVRKRAESFICEPLKGRVKLHITGYTEAHDEVGRGWVTVDGEQILNAAALTYMVKRYEIAHEVQVINNTLEYWNPDQRHGYLESKDQADKILHQQGIFSEGDYYWAIKDYPMLSIADALNSENAIIRGIAMIDRRLGKRKLRKISHRVDEIPFVLKLFQLRCEVEGIKPR